MTPINTGDFGELFAGQVQSVLGPGNQIVLDEEKIRANTRLVQLRNDIEVPDPSTPLEAWELFDAPANVARKGPHFSVEADSGYFLGDALGSVQQLTDAGYRSLTAPRCPMAS